LAYAARASGSNRAQAAGDVVEAHPGVVEQGCSRVASQLVWRYGINPGDLAQGLHGAAEVRRVNGSPDFGGEHKAPLSPSRPGLEELRLLQIVVGLQ